MTEFLRNNYPWLLWGVFIIILFSIPGDQLPEIPSFLNLLEPDKLVHLFLFIIFIWLMITGLMKPGKEFVRPDRVVFISLLTGTILAGGTEILQYFYIPGRIASVYDFIANEAGCFVGWWIHHRIHRLTRT